MKIVRPVIFLLILFLAGCSAPAPDASQSQQNTPASGLVATTTSQHPYAKYLEIAGFRIRERQPGKLEVKFVVINHSEADLGDVTLKLRLKASTAAPEDPPITEVEGRVLGLGPLEVKDVTGVGDTKLRVYELPDWQFLRADFDITFPAP